MELLPVTEISGFFGAGHSVSPAPAFARTSSSIRAVEDIADIALLFEDAVNVIVLRRPENASLITEARGALEHPGFRVMLPVLPSATGLANLMERMPHMPCLAHEVHFWTEVLAELTGCELVGVRLARVESAMCPRFHVDKVTVRLVGTFAGDGTEYIATEDVDRRFLGHAARGASDESSGLLRNGAQVHRANCGDVVLLKGEAWPDNAGRGAVHRSPAASAAEPRLVMTLDPLE